MTLLIGCFVTALMTAMIFSALGASLSVLFRMDSTLLEQERAPLAIRLLRSRPREAAMTVQLLPFLALTGALLTAVELIPTRSFGAHPALVWLVVSILLLSFAALSRRVGAIHPLDTLRLSGWLMVPFFFALFPLTALMGLIAARADVAGFSPGGEPSVSAQEIQNILDHDPGGDYLPEEEREMISSIIDFRDTLVREVMIPRMDTKALDVETGAGEARAFVASVGHSRVPVYEESMDRIVGILYSKDLLRVDPRNESVTLLSLLREPYFVPETKRVGDLLKRFQAERKHLAVVVDEYGGTAGIVTLEDLLEEIVGEIRDEYDKEVSLFEIIDDNTARVDAKIDLEELGEMIGFGFEASEDFESLGGLLLFHAGRILKPGDEVKVEPFGFRIESVQRQRIAKVIMRGEGLAAAVRREGGDTDSTEEIS